MFAYMYYTTLRVKGTKHFIGYNVYLHTTKTFLIYCTTKGTIFNVISIYNEVQEESIFVILGKIADQRFQQILLNEVLNKYAFCITIVTVIAFVLFLLSVMFLFFLLQNVILILSNFYSQHEKILKWRLYILCASAFYTANSHIALLRNCGSCGIWSCLTSGTVHCSLHLLPVMKQKIQFTF